METRNQKFSWQMIWSSALLCLISSASHAISIDDMMKAAGISSEPEKMAVVAGGDCGFTGQIMGCPEKGIVPPPNMPELGATLKSLTGLASASGATPDGRRGLLQLADRLSKINPDKLKGQIEALSKADPAYQFGAVRMVQFPEMGAPITDPLKLMDGLVQDARGKGDRLQQGAKQALNFLQLIHSRAKTEDQKEFLQSRITNLSNLIQSGAIPMAAKQAISPFYDGEGEAKINPLNNKPVSDQQAAIAMMMMGVEETFKDSENTGFKPAQIRTERELSLEYE